MKISIQGRVIETENIYQIDPIKGDDCWTSRNSWGPSSLLTHSGYEFTIRLFNEKKIKIWRSGDQTFNCDIWYMEKDMYEKKLKMVYDELDAFRNTVIEYWNKGKSEIPEINFKK